VHNAKETLRSVTNNDTICRANGNDINKQEGEARTQLGEQTKKALIESYHETQQQQEEQNVYAIIIRGI